MVENKKNQHECDCGCEHEHEHDIDCDCGCSDEDVVVLVDENGNEITFLIVATLERDGKEYAVLQQADEEEPYIEIYEVQEVEEDGEPMFNFLPVDEELYDLLCQQLEDELADLPDECEDSDCECHHHHDED